MNDTTHLESQIAHRRQRVWYSEKIRDRPTADGSAPLAADEAPFRVDEKFFGIVEQAVGENNQRYEDTHASPDPSVRPQTQRRHSVVRDASFVYLCEKRCVVYARITTEV